MLKLYFKESNGNERFLAMVEDMPAAVKIINNFIKERNFKSYYRISRDYGEYIEIDVGSHTEFFRTYEEKGEV